jgi:anti-sigma factor RsiW
MASEGPVTSCEQIQPLVRDATRGAGDDATRQMVHRHLDGCPACQRLAEEERALDRLLEAQLPQYAAPLSLKRRLQARLPPALEPVRRRRVVARWWAPASLAAAALVVLVIGLGSQLRPQSDPLVAEAVADHLRVVHRDRPVDIESGGPHQVKPWFTGRLDFALPTVFGGNDEFTLEGGSVGYYLDHQAAVLVYKRQLHKVSLFVFRADGLSFPRAEQAMARVRASVRHARGFSILLWRDGELGYALISDLNATELLRLGANIAGGS